MSRAFGNRLLKQFVIADPEIQVTCTAHILFGDTLCCFLAKIGQDLRLTYPDLFVICVIEDLIRSLKHFLSGTRNK